MRMEEISVSTEAVMVLAVNLHRYPSGFVWNKKIQTLFSKHVIDEVEAQGCTAA